MIKNTSGLAVQPCRLHERFYYHARLLYYILRQKARGFFAGGRQPLATPFFSLPPRRAFAGTVVPAPTSGPTRPTPGVPFVSRRKEPKACRGCAPGPRCVVTALSALAPLCSGSRRAASCVFTGSLASAAAWGTHSPAALAAPLWDADSLRVPFPLSSKKTAASPVGSTGRT